MNLERTFFVTTVTWKRTPIFRQHASAQLMVDVLKHYAEQGKFVLHEFVIMPDHLHLLLTPAKDISLERALDRKSTRLNSSHLGISYAVFCLKKKNYIPVELTT